MKAPIGIIGGSGLYRMEALRVERRVDASTPFGGTSAPILLGELEGVPVAFLARHGEHHRFLPSEVPARANLWALKELGVEKIVSVSAVGSLQERHHPGELRLVRQFIDHTVRREDTYFGQGLVAHVAFADPTCPVLTERLLEAGKELGLPLEDGATYVCMEGPAFSSRAESLLHRSWGADLIGMTQVTEAKLARELELCFAVVAMVTDYDAWQEETVDVAQVIAVMGANAGRVQALLVRAVRRLAEAPRACACGCALKNAVMTPPEAVPEDTRQRLKPLLGKYGY